VYRCQGGLLSKIVHKSVQLVSLVLQTAKLLEPPSYLASRKVVHCDLAARNVLVAELRPGDVNTDADAKIADFGLARTKQTLALKKGNARWLHLHMP